MHDNMRKSSEQPNMQKETSKHRSRRHLLRKGIVAATAALGAGALLETGIASAHTTIPADNVGNFSSSDGVTPAVTATGTNGSDGILAQSTGGDGLHAIGGGAGRSGVFAEGGVSDGVYGTSNGAGKSGVFGFNSSSTGYGLYGEADTGVAVRGGTTSGIAMQATGGTSGTAVQAIGGAVALNVQGIVQVQGNSVGQATLPAGSTSVTVTTSSATTSSIILLTLLGKPKGVLWVSRATGSFTIHSSSTQSSNLPIAYLIIN